MATVNYKCPNCGGPLKFNPDKQMFSCEYCMSDFEEQKIQQMYAEREAKQSQAEKAEAFHEELSKKFNVDYDLPGSIGKRYRRQDEIGTPFCITVDHESLNDNCVTVRDRDTMEQTRVPISELRALIDKKVNMNNLLRNL